MTLEGVDSGSSQDRLNYEMLRSIFVHRDKSAVDPLYTALHVYQPINSADFLYDALELDCPIILANAFVRRDFGFDKYTSVREKFRLIDLYTALRKDFGVQASELHRWQVQGELFDSVKQAIMPTVSSKCTSLLMWFERQSKVFTDLDLEARARLRDSLEQITTTPNKILEQPAESEYTMSSENSASSVTAEPHPSSDFKFNNKRESAGLQIDTFVALAHDLTSEESPKPVDASSTTLWETETNTEVHEQEKLKITLVSEQEKHKITSTPEHEKARFTIVPEPEKPNITIRAEQKKPEITIVPEQEKPKIICEFEQDRPRITESWKVTNTGDDPFKTLLPTTFGSKVTKAGVGKGKSKNEISYCDREASNERHNMKSGGQSQSEGIRVDFGLLLSGRTSV